MPVPLIAFSSKEPLPKMPPEMVEELPWLMINFAVAELPMVMLTALETPPPDPAVNVRLLPLLQLRAALIVILPTIPVPVPVLLVNTITLLLNKFDCRVAKLMLDVVAPVVGV